MSIWFIDVDDAEFIYHLNKRLHRLRVRRVG